MPQWFGKDTDWNDVRRIATGINVIKRVGAGHDPVSLDVYADVVLDIGAGDLPQEIGLDTQAANTVFAGPTAGVDDYPTFRLLVPADVPFLPVPAAEGSIIISDATPAWIEYGIGAAYTHLESNGTTLAWQANLTMADDAWIGLGAAAGRLVFDSTPTPDQIELTAADLNIVTTGHGIIHVDGVTAGYVLRADGTRYIPADAALTMPIAPVAQGDLIIADATPAWSILTLGAAAGYALVTTATTAVWDQTPTWTGIHTHQADLYMDDGVGNSPRLHLVGGSNNDTATIVLQDDAVAGASDLLIRLCDAAGASWMVIQTSAFGAVLRFDSLGNIRMNGGAYVGIAGGGRIVFDFTAAPDQVQVTAADLLIATAARGIIHVDGVAAGQYLRADGTRYVPNTIQLADVPAHNLLSATHGDTVVSAATRGDMVVGTAAGWDDLPHPGAAGYALTTDANDVIWDQTPVWTGLHTFDAGWLLGGGTADLGGIADALVLDANDDTTISAPTDDQIDIEIGGADDFTFTANSFDVLSGSYITMADDTWIGLGAAAGRLVFNSTPDPDQVEVTDADLNIVTTGHGIIHADGVTAGWVLRADGTRYIPADAALTMPIAPVAQGDLLIADATPAWSILTLGAAAGYALVTTATTATWDQTPTWTGSHTHQDNIILDDGVMDSPALLFIGGTNNDTAYIYLDDDAVAGDSDLIVVLCDAAGDSEFKVQDSATVDRATIDSDGNAQFQGGVRVGSIAGTVIEDCLIIDEIIYVNDSSNAEQTIGITINQGAYDDEILTLKSSGDVSHGMTDLTETDTYGQFQKAESTSGGLSVIGFKDSDGAAGHALYLGGLLGEAADTDKTNAAIGVITMFAGVKSGATGTTVGADGNLMVIRNWTTTRFIFDAEGSGHADVEWVAFDGFDDVALLADFETAMIAHQDPVKAQFVDFLRYNRADLERAKIVRFDDDNPGHAMVNFTKLSMLLVGAVRQLHGQIEGLKLTA